MMRRSSASTSRVVASPILHQHALPLRFGLDALGRYRADSVPDGRLVEPAFVHDALPLEHMLDGKLHASRSLDT